MDLQFLNQLADHTHKVNGIPHIGVRPYLDITPVEACQFGAGDRLDDRFLGREKTPEEFTRALLAIAVFDFMGRKQLWKIMVSFTFQQSFKTRHFKDVDSDAVNHGAMVIHHTGCNQSNRRRTGWRRLYSRWFRRYNVRGFLVITR